jgi:hypothetical protein
MDPPTQLVSTDTTIQVEWLPLVTGSGIGNSEIFSYNLYWDNGTGSTSIELVDELTQQFTVTGLQGGLNYKFKVRALNIYGYGEFSDEYVVEASDMPGRSELPIVTLNTQNVVITWVAPWSHFNTID